MLLVSIANPWCSSHDSANVRNYTQAGIDYKSILENYCEAIKKTLFHSGKQQIFAKDYFFAAGLPGGFGLNFLA